MRMSPMGIGIECCCCESEAVDAAALGLKKIALPLAS